MDKERKQKVVEQDNLRYVFEPGRNGSLTAPIPKKPSLEETLSQDRPHDAKVIMPEDKTVKMASGGLVGDENDQFKNWMVAQNQDDPWQGKSPLAPASPIPQFPASAPAPAADETTDGENKQKTQDSNPGHSPDDLKSYVQGQEDQIDKYGPDQEKAVMDSIFKSHGSLQNRASRGLAGLGDAIMGVAGKSSPGFLNNVTEREGRTDEMKARETPQLQEMNLSNLSAKEKLQMQDSSTPLGNAAKEFLKPILQQVFPGKAPQEYEAMLKNPAMAAANIGVPAQLLESKAKIAMAGAELGLHGQVARSNASNQELERKQNQEKLNQDKEKLKIEHPILNALGKFDDMGGNAGPATGPYGPTTIKGGKTYEWSPATGKYHLKS